MGLGDPEVGEQERQRLGTHRLTSVGVHGQDLGGDVLLGGGLLDQRGGDLCGLAVGDGPADDVAAEGADGQPA